MADVLKCVWILVCILCFLIVSLDSIYASAQAAEQHHPANDFSRHTLIKPKIYHGREKRQISTTKENDEGGGHIHHLTVEFDIDKHKYIIDLKLNNELLPKGYFVRTQKNGTDVVHRPKSEDTELCHYHGKIRGIENSWAAISTCRKGLTGVIYDGKDMHYVEKATNEEHVGIEDLHYLYSHSDLAENNKTCGYEGDAGPLEHDHRFHKSNNEFNRILRYKRDAEPKIRGPYNSNKLSRYVELVLVVDHKEFLELDQNTNKVEKHCKDIANIINGLYAPLNIFIALVGVVIWTERDEIDFSTNGDQTLTNFLHYRREKLIQHHPNDNAQLLTKVNFDNGVVGKALKGPICTYTYSGGVNTDHSPVVGLVATTVAHEMGHNFGMEHDKNDCECPEERCIMAPSSSAVPPTHWSSCSLSYLAIAFEHGMDYCLRNKPESLFGSPVCGNGFVEPGEQCDCGIPEHCKNPCCNATTCMLYSNASCATGECCDLNTCKPKNAGTLCRSADYECDLPEYCTGQSEYCPADVYKQNAVPCDDEKAYCHNGKCRTRSDQCKLLWGSTGKTSDEQCYKMNIKGTRHGNCGYNKMNETYMKCEEENILCGMLHCTHLNEKLEFGMESVSILSHSFINLRGHIIPCRTALVDLGLSQVDPGLTPDGAKCGEGKMCVNQKCMAVAELHKIWPSCPNNCNGNGVCNSKGHCHCNSGYAPPYCDYPGPGGSEDSGPESDPNSNKEFINGMLIFFVGVVPLFGLIAFIAYYLRHNVKHLSWKKSPTSSKSPPKSRSNSSFQPESAKRTEDNHSLLAEDNHNPALTNEFFGHFKGYTLTPIKTATSPKSEPDAPLRPAPPVPVPTSPNLPAVIPNGITKSPAVVRSNTNVNAKVSLFNNKVERSQSFKQNTLQNGLQKANNASVAPALPPLNAGSTARPIISSPILENSTCTAKELISPLRNAPKVPVRPAPEVQVTAKDNNKTTRPLSSPDVAVNAVVPIQQQSTEIVEVKKPAKESTLNRIASFLKPADKKPQIDKSQTNSLPRNASMRVNKIDKNVLRNMEISKPIPQNNIDLPVNVLPVDSEETKAVVMRAQSMRDNNAKPKPSIQTFGSMRQANGPKRPLSIPNGSRPKSPPPPRPTLPEVQEEKTLGGLKIPGIPGYQQPLSTNTSTVNNTKDNKQNQYDDCLNGAPLAESKFNSPSSDNIYAVIEETPITSPETRTHNTSASGSSESVGLLGEIVSEIQNRNFDSIYSTGTMDRKRKEQKLSSPSDTSDTYVNTSSIYKAPESVYSNMNNVKSSASSTSSGYINPSSVNPPIKPMVSKSNENSGNEKKAADSNLSTFKKEETAAPKAYTSPFQRSSGPFASTFNKNPPSTAINSVSASSEAAKATTETNNKLDKTPSATTPTAKAVGTAKPFNRQITPPNIKTRKPSPTRTVSPAPSKNSSQKTVKSVSNSPDLVTSCSTNSKSGTNPLKPPDVLSNSVKKPTALAVKPVIQNGTAKTVPSKVNKSVSMKTPTEKKPSEKPPISSKITKSNSEVGPAKTMTIGAKMAARQNSNVASLQQKFENKTPATRPVAVGKK